jgi:predicted transcriptional regulator
MATEQVIEERVLDIFQAHPELMAEEVFPLYEEAHGDTSRSNSIHTTISRLTRKGLLYVVRRQISPLTHKTVNVWKFNDGSVVPVVDNSVVKSTNKQLNDEAEILRAKNKGLEETNMRLLGLIEDLRNQVQALTEEKAGVDL